MTVLVLVPVLDRPHRVKPLLESIEQATSGPYRVLFIVDPTDTAQQAAVDACGGQRVTVEGSYARKINTAVRLAEEPLLFLGADDLDFQPGWFEAARALMRGEVGVVGVNDLLERHRPNHATHFLMARQYAESPAIDGGAGPLCELYRHNFVDDELIGTARKRGAYAYAADSHVRHEHWMNGAAEDDETYRKGRIGFREDRQLFREREHLWA